MIKYILAWRFVKTIFKEAKAYEWYNGKAFFSVNEDVLKALFPKEYAEANRLLQFLNCFSTIPATSVPTQSIIREFIGGSVFTE